MRKLRLILQDEKAECGLACLAMVASSFGRHYTLAEIRDLIPSSGRGLNLADLIEQASQLQFVARPLKLSLEEIDQLQLPAILHWDLDHFVVLVRVKRKTVTIANPISGLETLKMGELSLHFTGIALELTPGVKFETKPDAPRFGIKQLTGLVSGLNQKLVWILATSTALELLNLLAPLLSQLIVDNVVTTNDSELLLTLLIGFGILLLIQVVLGFARSWMIANLGQTVSFQWRANVFRHLIHLPISWFERRHLGDVMNKFRMIDTLQQTISTTLVEAILDGAFGLVALVVMYLYSPLLTLIVITSVVTYALIRLVTFLPLRAVMSKRITLSARETSHFAETLRSIVTLRVYTHEERRVIRWLDLIVNVQNQDYAQVKMANLVAAANGLVFGLQNLLVLGLGARQIILPDPQQKMSFSVGMLFAFVAYKSQFSAKLVSSMNSFVQLRMLKLQTARLADITLAPPAPEFRGIQPQSGNYNESETSVKIVDLSFRYGANDPWILRNLSLSVAPGECIAITGPSGAGKTSLLRLMLGLVPPTAGQIMFGGKVVGETGIRQIRRSIGAVMQDDMLLSGTLAENVSFFDDRVDMWRVEEACSIAGVLDEIRRLPMGFSTRVGELGVGLSGGQRQRVFIARALYNRPKFFLFDEATSNLDVENERRVLSKLRDQPVTKIFIAHRPQTIALADRVYVLSDGQLTERL